MGIVKEKQVERALTSNLPSKPEGEETKAKWMEIYKDYKTIPGSTMQSVADLHQISKGHVSKVVRWCDTQVSQGREKGLYREVTTKRMERSLDRLDNLVDLIDGVVRDKIENEDGEALLSDKHAIKNIITVMTEVRKTNETVGSLLGIMTVEKQTEAPQINIALGNTLRGTGAKPAPVVEVDPDE